MAQCTQTSLCCIPPTSRYLASSTCQLNVPAKEFLKTLAACDMFCCGGSLHPTMGKNAMYYMFCCGGSLHPTMGKNAMYYMFCCGGSLHPTMGKNAMYYMFCCGGSLHPTMGKNAMYYMFCCGGSLHPTMGKNAMYYMFCCGGSLHPTMGKNAMYYSQWLKTTQISSPGNYLTGQRDTHGERNVCNKQLSLPAQKYLAPDSPV